MAQPTLLNVDEGEVLSDRAERTVRTLVEHPLIDATWSRYEAGESGPPPHVHHEHVDSFYVVEGELEFGVGPEVGLVRARAGTFVLVPPNVVHTFRNASDATARWLNFHAPSTGFVAYLRGERDGFDSYDPPADGGRSAAEATVVSVEKREWAEHDRRSIAVVGHAPQLTVTEVIVEAEFELAPSQDETVLVSYFVLDGEIELVLGDRTVRATRRTWMSALPGERYELRNPGPGPATLLNLRAPA